MRFLPLCRLGSLALAGTLAACGGAADLNAPPEQEPTPSFNQAATAGPEAELAAMMDGMNVALAAEGMNYRAAVAEYVTDGAGGEAGGTVLAKDVGNKQLGSDFVPNDARRAWSSPTAITYAIDQTLDAVPFGGGLSAAATDAAIVRAMGTWDALNCSALGLTRNPDGGLDIGVVAFQASGGAIGSPFIFADVQHAGFRDLNFAGGVLGVTFTFVWVGGGVPTDIDGNGKQDVAFREIYYDPSWIWADDGVSNIDVETVALHEAGHGLSQAHFGKVTLKNGVIKASPRAVMNALYDGPFRSLAGNDNGGHCSNWGSWPNN